MKVGHTHVHGVVGGHLVPLLVGAGWGLEETEKGVCITLQFVVGCATSVCDTGTRQDLGGLQ